MTYYTPAQSQTINWPDRWRRYHLPQRLWGVGLDHCRTTPGNATALTLAREFTREFPHRHPSLHQEPGDDHRHLVGRGMILVGAAGSGKTHLACATATAVHQEYNHPVLYLPVTNFFFLGRRAQQLQNAPYLEPDDRQILTSILELQRQVLRVPLLVWDDLGKEYSAGTNWVGMEVHRILRTRFDAALPTVITTNIPLPEWSTRYEPAMFSFLHEAFDAVPISGTDWRRAGK